MVEHSLWDFLDRRGKNVILQWVSDDKLATRDRAALNQKIKRLQQMDFQLAIKTRLLAGPIYCHVYKLKIHTVMLRPMLCRGPINNEAEYTFLLGAVETGGKLPDGSKEKAEENRKVILDDPTRRELHRRIP